MSDDLVKRLREYGDDPQDVSLGEWAEWSHKCADRIEELKAENERFRLALEETVRFLWDDMSKQESVGKHGGYIYMKCRAALAELTGGNDE
jgi:hypothetical protein